MEFNEKLQELRKRKGLTQEALAEALFVSRTAISKWESGRGFPNIESLKAISQYFSVSLDELLSNEELLVIAETDLKEKERTFQDLIFGMLDCGIALLLLLPLFRQKSDGIVHAVSLLGLTQIQSYLKTAYLLTVFTTMLFGSLTLSLQNCQRKVWLQSKRFLSLAFSIGGICLFIISSQPYAAVFTFLFFTIKVFMLIKR